MFAWFRSIEEQQTGLKLRGASLVERDDLVVRTWFGVALLSIYFTYTSVGFPLTGTLSLSLMRYHSSSICLLLPPRVKMYKNTPM